MDKHNSFTNTKYQSIYFSENCCLSALEEIISLNNFQSTYLISTPSLYETQYYKDIRSVLAKRTYFEFPDSKAHTPISTVTSALKKIASEKQLDVIVAFGGSSVMDLAKAVVHRHSSKIRTCIVSIPTTLSGAEYFHSGVMTSEDGIKTSFSEDYLAPKWIILDPVIVQDTPPLLWLSTGYKSFIDCIESVSSKKATPISDQMAFSGARLYQQYLLRSAAKEDMVAKQNVMFAPSFSMSAAINTTLGLVASCRHQLGAKFDIPHGVASAIMTTHVMRWNLPHAMKSYAELARVLLLGNKNDDASLAEALVEYASELASDLELPSQLRKFVNEKSALQSIAHPIKNSVCTTVNPRAVNTEQEIFELLEAAW